MTCVTLLAENFSTAHQRAFSVAAEMPGRLLAELDKQIALLVETAASFDTARTRLLPLLADPARQP